MRLLVLGGTGETGRLIVATALERGHEVTSFSRAPSGRTHGLLQTVQGDARDAAAVAAALDGHDAVAFALGSPGLGATTIRREGARAVIEAMRSAGVDRLVALSEAMLFGNLGPVSEFMGAQLFGNVLEDARGMEAAIRESSLRWTIVRAVRLINDPDPTYRIARDCLPGRMSSVNRSAVAAAMLDLLAQPQAVEATFGVSS